MRIPPVKIYRRKGDYNEDLIKLIMHARPAPRNGASRRSQRADRRLPCGDPPRAGDVPSGLATTCSCRPPRRCWSATTRAMKPTDRAARSARRRSVSRIISATTAWATVRTRYAAPCGASMAAWCWISTAPIRKAKARSTSCFNENMMRMFFGIYMIMVFDPQILFNDGYYDLIDVRIPEGSLLKPRFPAALSGRTHALGPHLRRAGRACWARKPPNFSMRPGFRPPARICSIPASARPTDNGSSCSRSASAAFPGGRWATDPTGIRYGRTSPTCPNEFLERYFPLRDRALRNRPRLAGGASVCTAAATAST